MSNKQFFVITAMLATIILFMADPEGTRYAYRVAVAKMEYGFNVALNNLITWLRHLAA